MTCFEGEEKRPKVVLPNADDYSDISQGAEAVLYKGDFFGRPCVIKQRIPKAYRHPELDARLLKQRTVQEIRCLARLTGIVNVPQLYAALPLNHSFVMELIPGTSVKHALLLAGADCGGIAAQIGQALANMHNASVIHGDLTTSNMIHFESQIFLIDFGLAQVSKVAEDKAVDLYVLERSLGSVHSELEGLFGAILEAYWAGISDRRNIELKLQEVQKRGRKRSMVG